MRTIIRGISCVFMFTVFLIAGFYLFLWPWFPVAEAGFPTAGCVAAGLWNVGWLTFIIDQFWRE